jgi:hypothetical protein
VQNTRDRIHNKTFSSKLTEGPDKLEWLSLASLFCRV